MTFSVDASADGSQTRAYQMVGAPVRRVEIASAPVYFADDTKWSADRYFQSEPPSEVWREVKPEQFFQRADEPAM